MAEVGSSDWPFGNSDMARRIRAHDWAATPLGAIGNWPQSLKTALDVVLGSGHAMQLAWGPERTILYNDAYAPMLGKRHPAALGGPFREAWPEIWGEIEPLVARVFAGETVRFEDLPLTMTRHDYAEETWWSFSYSPVRDESGQVAGLLNVTVDATPKVRADRAEQAISASEERLRTVLEGIAEPFYALDADWRFLFASRAALKLWGRTAEDVLHRGFLDVFPSAAGSEAYEAHRRVMRTRESERLETVSPIVHRWIEIDFTPTLRGGLSVGFRDIEVRKQAEERQALVLELADALRPLADPEQIRSTAAQVLGRHLGANRVAYAENRGDHFVVSRNYVDGAAEMLGRQNYLDFGPDILDELEAGHNRVQADIRLDSRLSVDQKQALASADVGASLNVPLVKSGQLVAFLGVNYPAPHAFEPREIALVEEVAERTWAAVERARAEVALRRAEQTVRESEARFRALVTAGGNSIYRMSPDWRQMYQLDSQSLAITSEPIEDWIDKYILEDDRPRVHAAVAEALRTRSLFELEHRVRLANGNIGWVLSRAVPLFDADGEIVEWFGAGTDVTDRRSATEALRDRETDLARVQRIGGIGGLDIDVAGGMRSRRSPEYLRLHGLPPGNNEETHADWRARVHPDDLATAEHALWSVLAGNASSYVSEYRIIRPNDGAVRWIEARADIERDSTGKAIRLVGAHIDITEQKLVQQALHDSEERFRQFGEASQDVLWIRDAETLQWEYLTPAFEAIYGLERAKALSGDNYRGWLDLIIAEDRATAMGAIQRVRLGEHVTFDYRIQRPADGAIRSLRNTDFPIVDASGNVTLIGGIGHDLTELRETERRLQTLMEGIPQLVWRAVDGGHWTWSSPQWTEFTGVSAAESAGLGWLRALHPDDREPAMHSWQEAIRSGRLEIEARIRHAASAEYRWFQTRATPVRDEGGVIVEWLGTSTDIDDLRDLQAQQQVLVAELQHRTRNLMGVVRSMADKTSRASTDLADFRDRFRDRLEALARVQGLLSRLNEHERVTFDELIDTEMAAMHGTSDKVLLQGPKGIRLRSSTLQSLAMALHELATNAVKYGALGQAAGRLAVTWSCEQAAADDAPWLHIDWRESGVTMHPPGAAPRGTGLGRELIEHALPYQLRARTTFTLESDGVHCTISLPVSGSSSRTKAPST